MRGVHGVEWTAWVCGCLLAVQPLIGQYPPPGRDGTPLKFEYRLAGGERGLLRVSESGAAWRFRDDPLPYTSSDECQLPFPQSRCLTPLWSESEYVVAGWAPGSASATLARLSFGDWSAQPLRLLPGSAEYPGKDFVAAEWNPHDEMLYVVEGMSGTLQMAPMPTGGALPPAGAFVTIGDANDAYMLGLFRPSQHGLFAAGPGHVYLVNRTRLRISFTLVGGQWEVTVTEPQRSSPPSYVVMEPELVPARGPLTLSGPLGAFDVVDAETQQVVLSGMVATAGWNHVAVPPGSLLSGEAYVVRGQGSSQAAFLALDRRGEPLDVQDTTFTVPAAMPGEHRVGSKSFGVGVVWVPRDGATLPLSATVYLWFTVTGEGQPEPVVHVDADADGTLDAALLSGATAGPGRAKVLDPDEKIAPVADPIAVPDDPELVGSTMWFQYAADLGGGEVLVSEVVALPILAAGSQAQSQAPDPGARDAAIQRWLSTLRDADGQRALQRMQGALRRRD